MGGGKRRLYCEGGEQDRQQALPEHVNKHKLNGTRLKAGGTESVYVQHFVLGEVEWRPGDLDWSNWEGPETERTGDSE